MVPRERAYGEDLCQEGRIGMTSDAESPFIVTWKCPGLQFTRQASEPSLEREK